MFQTIQESFNLDWAIRWQGIIIADKASGVVGDITIERDGELILAVEVTERPVDRARVVSTFNTKISPKGIKDYLFMTSLREPPEDAIQVARQYFAQGHEVAFVNIDDWILMSLTTIGTRCREIFKDKLLLLFEAPGIPQSIKVAWNDQVKALME